MGGVDTYLTPPPGWHYSAHPWHELDEIDDLPELKQVGASLLPEFFHFAIGTEGMWAKGWPGVDDFALFLRFQVFEGHVHMDEARSAGVDIPEAFERVKKVLPLKHWKRTGIVHMTRYLVSFMEEEGRPDVDELPPHGPRAVVDYAETRPEAAMLWLERLRSHAADAYASAMDNPPPSKRKRVRLTDDFLRNVARIYAVAENSGLPPTREVANHFRAPHSTAAKWVGSARRKEFLPPAGTLVRVAELRESINQRRQEIAEILEDDSLTGEQVADYVDELDRLGRDLNP